MTLHATRQLSSSSSSSHARQCSAVLVSARQRSTVLVRARQCLSVLVSARQCLSVLVSARQCSSALVSARQCSSVLVSARQCSSVLLSTRQCSSVLVSARQCSSVLVSAWPHLAEAVHSPCEQLPGRLHLEPLPASERAASSRKKQASKQRKGHLSMKLNLTDSKD